MEFFKTNSRGIALCLAIAVPAWILGTFFPIVGGAGHCHPSGHADRHSPEKPGTDGARH